MANKSKNKGKAYERDVCKFLTDLIGENFQRVPNSGAYVGGANAFRANKLTPEQLLLADGDIIVPAKWGHVSLECKFYKDFRWHHLFLSEEKNLEKWIEQASGTNKLIWFLCFKINRQGQFIVFDSKFSKYFTLKDHMIYGSNIICDLEAFFNENAGNITNLPLICADNDIEEK